MHDCLKRSVEPSRRETAALAPGWTAVFGFPRCGKLTAPFAREALRARRAATPLEKFAEK
jgi:hypothetical protein